MIQFAAYIATGFRTRDGFNTLMFAAISNEDAALFVAAYAIQYGIDVSKARVQPA